MSDANAVCGVLLAGGKSRRMGNRDKALVELNRKTVLSRVIEIAQPQVTRLSLNSNADPENYEGFGFPVISDVVSGYAGPLAGILTGMNWVREKHPRCKWLASFACDAPFIPSNLVSRCLQQALENDANLACARSGGRVHPVIGLWSVSLYVSLKDAIISKGIRKVDEWTASHRLVEVEWSDEPFDPFFNINSPEDLVLAEKMTKLGRFPSQNKMSF